MSSAKTDLELMFQDGRFELYEVVEGPPATITVRTRSDEVATISRTADDLGMAADEVMRELRRIGHGPSRDRVEP